MIIVFVKSPNSDRRIWPEMNAADIIEFWELVGALWTCEGQETSPLKKLKVTNDLLDFFYDKPVHTMGTDVTHIREEAERVNCAALEKIFGLGSARVQRVPLPSSLPRHSLPPCQSVLQRGPRGARFLFAGSLTVCQIVPGSRSHVVWPSARPLLAPSPSSPEVWPSAR